MKLFRIMLTIAFVTISMQGYTQKKEELKEDSKAAELYNDYGYGAALEAVDENDGTVDASQTTPVRLLADSYRLTGDTHNAEYWYGVITKGGNAEPLDMLYYAQALQSNGRYPEAKKWFLEYSQAAGNDSNVGQRLADVCDIAASLQADADVLIKNMEELNSEKLDFSPMFYRDGLVFTSTRDQNKNLSKRKDLWTNDNFMDLYFAEVSADDISSGLSTLFKDANIKYHDGTATFTQDQNTMYFARSNSGKGGKRRKDKKGITRLKIYESKSGGKGWSEAKELAFNDDDFDTCHPTLSEDGNVLFFSSDRPGGFGGMDLYKSRRMGNGWSEPENLGPEINTEGNEIFPYIHEDGTLFFASNGLPGIGGLDIFSTVGVQGQDYNTTWSKPNNLGKPLNTKKDDFGLIVDISGTKGYFTSNREGGHGMDDIYSFICKKGIHNIGKSIAESTLVTTTISVCDEETGVYLTDVNVNVFTMDEKNGNDGFAMNQLDDEFLMELKPIDASREKYTLNLVKRRNGKSQNADSQFFTNKDGKFSPAFSTKEKYQLKLTKEGYEELDYEFFYNEYLKNKIDCIPMRKLNCTQFVGTVINKKYQKVLPDSDVAIMNKCTGEITKTTADREGKFSFCMDCDCEYEIMASKKYFSADLKIAEKFPCNKTLALDFYLENKDNSLLSLNAPSPSPQPVTYAANPYPPVNYNYPPPSPNYNPYKVGMVIELKNIFYDFDKSYIREDAAPELDKVVDLLRNYPSMRIELGSHTDARATNKYNQALSQRRANEAVDYIVKRGIARYRIVAMGYGENVLKNHCADGMDCPEELHQRNRRTEIKVLEFDPRELDVRYIDNAPRIIDTPNGRMR